MIYHMLSTACLCAFLALGCTSTMQTFEPEPEQAPPTPVAFDGGGPSLEPIYFDTDRAQLREDARKTLKQHAQTILDHPDWGVVTIEGHCDQRGTEEYNLALGDRRASVVVRYLKNLGVPASRLQTRSFGEMKPAVPGHSESAWGMNRRAEIQGEGSDLAKR